MEMPQTVEVPDSQDPDSFSESVGGLDTAAAKKGQADLEEFIKTVDSQRVFTGATQPYEDGANSLQNEAVAKYEPAGVWEQLESLQNAMLCKKCQMPVDATKAIMKNKTKGEERPVVICRVCNNATTMLSRHLGWPLPSFTGLEPEAQLAFWRKCSDIANQQGRLDYQHLRASLTMTMVEANKEIAKVTYSSEALPLSVVGSWSQISAKASANLIQSLEKFGAYLFALSAKSSTKKGLKR